MKKIFLILIFALAFIGCDKKYTEQECKAIVPQMQTIGAKTLKDLTPMYVMFSNGSDQIVLTDSTSGKKIIWSPITSVKVYCDGTYFADANTCDGNQYIKLERDWSSPKLKKM